MQPRQGSPGITMEKLDPLRPAHGANRTTQPARWTFPTIVIAIAAVLLLLVLGSKLQGMDVPRLLMGTVAVAFLAAIFLARISYCRPCVSTARVKSDTGKWPITSRRFSG